MTLLDQLTALKKAVEIIEDSKYEIDCLESGFFVARTTEISDF